MSKRLIETSDIVATLIEQLKAIDAKRVFLVHGTNSFIFCGAADAMKQVGAVTGIQVTEFSDFSVNPKDEEAQKGLGILLDAKPDVIIAIGGGSVIDMAKLIRHYAAEQKYSVPLCAIPTTAGTGAEATHFAVVYKNGMKHSIEAEDILPDIAILYSPFTYGNNAYLTACTGFDALAQAIEAFWNPNATDESDACALRAISYIHSALPQCVANLEDTRLRDDLLYGAYWAGRAINITKTTAPHAFSYAFTTHCGYPHGHAVAITFPFFAKLNMEGSMKDVQLRQSLNLDDKADLQKYFEMYIKDIGLSENRTFGVLVPDLLAQVNIERLKNNPIIITAKIVSQLQSYLEGERNMK